MLCTFRSLISRELSIVQIVPKADRVVLVAQPKAMDLCVHVAAAEPRGINSSLERYTGTRGPRPLQQVSRRKVVSDSLSQLAPVTEVNL